MSKLRDVLVSNPASVSIGLVVIFVILLCKHVIGKMRKDPRLVKFAETLPGPPTVPFLGNGLDFYHGGCSK